MNLEKYYYVTSIGSSLAKKVFAGRDTYDWFKGNKGDMYTHNLDQDLIWQEPLLAKIHPFVNGRLDLLIIPPKSMYQWHVDQTNDWNLNFYSTLKNKHTIFIAEKGDHPWETHDHLPIREVKALIPLVCAEMDEDKWNVLNPRIVHAGNNFNTEPVMIFQYVAKTYVKDKPNYTEIVEYIKNYERELNTKQNEYPVYPEQEGEWDRPLNPYSPV